MDFHRFFDYFVKTKNQRKSIKSVRFVFHQATKAEAILVHLLLLRIAHTLADFVLHRVFGVVELADTATEAAHEFGYLLAAEQQEHHKENEHELGGAKVAEEQQRKQC
jgi:hypothetical protein